MVLLLLHRDLRSTAAAVVQISLLSWVHDPNSSAGWVTSRSSREWSESMSFSEMCTDLSLHCVCCVQLACLPEESTMKGMPKDIKQATACDFI